MKLKLNIKGKEYTVEIQETDRDTVKIRVQGEEFVFKQKEEEKEKLLVAKSSLPKRNFTEKKIKAPIAGIISEVFVKERDVIKKGKKVILLSAMKMENEIISDFEGRVKKVSVKKDQKVKEGDILIVLE
ncbi:MAG: acetyl-CoA carboxylase biotin carboxyl carrier protein subunit [Candidatus Nealsonbacteria bacterium]